MSETSITVRMTRAEAHVLRQRAKSLGISLAEYVRAMSRQHDALEEIQRGLDKHQRETLAAVESLAVKLADAVREAMG